MTRITEHLAELRERITRAAADAGRPASEVRIMAVSKGQPAEAVLAAHAAGLCDFGENYVQEAIGKMAAVPGDLRWHFIGNKIGRAHV